MAFHRKGGWRRIVVAERVFYWHCYFSGCPCCNQNDGVQVRPEERSHRVLRVLWQQGLGVPGAVRLAIEAALARGWPDGLAELTLRGEQVPGLGPASEAAPQS